MLILLKSEVFSCTLLDLCLYTVIIYCQHVCVHSIFTYTTVYHAHAIVCIQCENGY